MMIPSPTFEAWARRLRLCCLLLPLAAAQAGGQPAITAITVERDCFGCASGQRLLLRHDGLARHTQIGKARHGTPDSVTVGLLARADFAALACLITNQGFFALADSFEEDEATRDGAWLSISVETAAGQRKTVWRRGEAGPPALGVIDAALKTTQARLEFRPSGQSLAPP